MRSGLGTKTASPPPGRCDDSVWATWPAVHTIPKAGCLEMTFTIQISGILRGIIDHLPQRTVVETTSLMP